MGSDMMSSRAPPLAAGFLYRDRRWPARSALAGVAAEREKGDVVVGAAGRDAVEQLIAELLQREVGQPGELTGDPGDALVDAGALMLDQPVGVEHNCVAGAQRDLVVGAQGGRLRAEQPL